MTLHVYTARYSIRDDDRLDITRSGAAKWWHKHHCVAPGEFLAPSNDLLWPHRKRDEAIEERWSRGEIDDAMAEAERTALSKTYTEGYVAELRVCYRVRRWQWDALMSLERICVVCYCPEPVRCHRLIAAHTLEKLGAIHEGEITT